MKKLPEFLFCLSVVLISCKTNTTSNLHNILKEENLKAQIFSIDITRDTTIVTASRCIIKIPVGSLKSDVKNVQFEIKEAINLKDILIAGLTTMSSSNTLSSAGMIYINPVNGSKVTISKALEVLVPTETFNTNMKIYKGEKIDDGKIDWQKPEALPVDETIKKINAGEQIFNTNCSNCHKVNQDYTGPSLLGVTYRRPKQWLYDYIASPEKMMSMGDCYSIELFRKWKPTIMTAYPNLKEGGGIDSILAYLEAETVKTGIKKYAYEKTCCDSCEMYKRKLANLEDKRNKLLDEQYEYYNLNRTVQLNNTIIKDTTKLNKIQTSATFYTIKVATFGWFNLDCLLKTFDDCKESELNVKIENENADDYVVSLVIPSLKVFITGNKIDRKKEYHFENGGEEKISLPQNEKCFLVAYKQRDEKIFFAKSAFTSSLKQTISIIPNQTTEEKMMKEFESIGVKSQVEEVKNMKEIKRTENKIEDLKKSLPKECGCDLPVKDNIISDAIEYRTLQR